MKAFPVLFVIFVLIGTKLVAAEDWRQALKEPNHNGPPYMLEQGVKDGAIPWSEVKYIDVIKSGGGILYLNWYGKILTDSDAAFDEFTKVNSEYLKIKGKDMYDITNVYMLRFIGDFSKDECIAIGIKVEQFNLKKPYFYYPNPSIIFYNGRWKRVE